MLTIQRFRFANVLDFSIINTYLMKPLNPTKVLLPALAGCAFSLLLASCASAQQPPVNIALGKKVAFNKNPNYALCTDPDDKLQLTDGKLASEGPLRNVENTTSIWVQKGTVGWGNVMPVVITIDLGSVQPISGVSYSTAAGRAGVTWPGAIYMATSDDNKTWHAAGNLVALSRKNGMPPTDGYANFKYVTHDLHTKGRYISFGVVQTPYAFVDEIAVYKGDDAWLNQPVSGEAVPSMEQLVKQTIITSYAQRRLSDDNAAIRAEVAKSNLSAGAKSTFDARLEKDSQATADMQPLPDDFKTILPLNDTHRDILAVHGEVLAAQGYKPLTVWKLHRYAWLPLLVKPDSKSKPQLNFSMLGNQFRSDDLLLTNSTGQEQHVSLQLNNAPQGAQKGWLNVYSVAWTDTQQGTPVADALMPVAAQNGGYQIDIPAGMTRKVWFTVDSSKVPAGLYKSTFTVNGESVPMSVNVSKVAMNTPRFSMGMWDYTDVPAYSGLNLGNRQAAIDMMRSHYVDTPWATGAALPMPKASDFTANSPLIEKLNFSHFDKWVALWPGARRYFTFPSVGDSFAGAKMGTPEFDTRVGTWAKALSAHMKSLGLKPSQLGILLVDEPHSDEQAAIIAAWAKAINASAPELTLFEDPTWKRPDQITIQDAITQADVICPNFPIYKSGGEPVQKYFENLHAQGKELWFYQCTGPVRLYDPQAYYRDQPWQAFNIGATGQGFWAFGDTSGAATSWNEYATARVSYAPAFIDKDTVYDSVHWDAAREGVEDYEELAMLQDAINASNNGAWKSKAQKVLNDAVAKITGSWTGDYTWEKGTDPEMADVQLQRVQEMLGK
jgi:hypothetical protein